MARLLFTLIMTASLGLCGGCLDEADSNSEKDSKTEQQSPAGKDKSTEGSDTTTNGSDKR